LPRADSGQQTAGRIQIIGSQRVTRLLLEGRDLGIVIPLLLQCVPHLSIMADQHLESARDCRRLGAGQAGGDEQPVHDLARYAVFRRCRRDLSRKHRLQLDELLLDRRKPVALLRGSRVLCVFVRGTGRHQQAAKRRVLPRISQARDTQLPVKVGRHGLDDTVDPDLVLIRPVLQQDCATRHARPTGMGIVGQVAAIDAEAQRPVPVGGGQAPEFGRKIARPFSLL
jgi:hypothetical protein